MGSAEFFPHDKSGAAFRPSIVRLQFLNSSEPYISESNDKKVRTLTTLRIKRVPFTLDYANKIAGFENQPARGAINTFQKLPLTAYSLGPSYRLLECAKAIEMTNSQAHTKAYFADAIVAI